MMAAEEVDVYVRVCVAMCYCYHTRTYCTVRGVLTVSKSDLFNTRERSMQLRKH